MTLNPHEGHRDRVRKRFLQDGNLDNFEEHQILELLLFYAIPRKDTNETAHKMIAEFGGLEQLLNAPPEAIAARTGISINAAILVSLTGMLKKRCEAQWKMNCCFKTPEQIKKFFTELLKDSHTEKFYIACLDKNKRLIKNLKIAEGDASSVYMKLPTLLAHIAQYGASYAVCAHNHPSGTKTFSLEDNQTTIYLRNKLAEYGITLMDHVLVCGDEAVTMSELKKFKF